MPKRKKYRNYYDDPLAYDVFSALLAEYDKRNHYDGIFSHLDLPESEIDFFDAYRTDHPVDYAQFLFWMALLQRGDSSESIVRSIVELHDKEHEMFDPEYVLLIKHEAIVEDLKSHRDRGYSLGIYSPEKLAQHWRYNSQVLYDCFNSDPRNIFASPSCFKQAFTRLRLSSGQTIFQGMGVKILALLDYYLQKEELIPKRPLALPPDIYVMGCLWATGVLSSSSWARRHKPTKYHPHSMLNKWSINVYYDFLIDIAFWSEKFMAENDFSALDLIPAIWLLGHHYCRKSFLRKWGNKDLALKIAKHPEYWPKNYQDPCAKCPIKKWCKWDIPLSPYSKWGLLVKWNRRVEYPG